MSVYWIRAFHAELDREVVMPLEAIAHHSGWEQVGEPSDDPDALRADLARDQAVAAAEAEAALATGEAMPPPPAPKPSAPKTGADTPESSAPAGADPKE